ncbi:WD repeat-containing protein on Y chromosome-like [Cyclopterus lumpus]|uniref:WD repeat-containing protein on Y chromosome-like n=1 Tax=Cyclopterus lumpus TaxID=8103 RepID=UPI0014864C0F|nr:WD repeat-containing protein on Y chromosome-like [Cyclopterus lumpus]
MEGHTQPESNSHTYMANKADSDTAEDLPKKAAMDPESESKNEQKSFTAAKLPRIKEIFMQADTDGNAGLDIEEFCSGLKEVFDIDNDEELIPLFYQIDTNCDGTVDFVELLEFLNNKTQASEGLKYQNIFAKHVTVTPSNHYNNIVKMIFIPYLPCESADPTGEPRTYQRGQYISITSDGVFTIWSDRFDNQSQILLNKKAKALPFSHHKKMKVNGMAYMDEVRQVAVTTSEREVLFYSWSEFPQLFVISHTLIVEDTVCAIKYGSDGTKAVLSFVDVNGYLYVLISKNVKKNGFFRTEMYEKISLQDYPTIYLSTLLNQTSQYFKCAKIPIFNDICTQIQYFPTIDSLAICGSSSKTMVLVTLPTTESAKLKKTVFQSPADKEFFTCVEYSPLRGYLLTGGTDGLVREWYVHNTMTCKQSFTGHVKPITHIILNPKDKYLVTLSTDKNICVWSEEKMLILQNFQVQDMNIEPIVTMCYNTYNNELILANTAIGTYIGRGTDVYQNALTSHDKPLCCALYHSIYNQVVSVCRDGVVTVWDILTGMVSVRFNLTQDNHEEHTAIALDGPQRRLITGSQDGKLRLWNFNSGTLLAILPVTLPKEVTGIVCLNDRVFVSVRNSNIIYDLDMEGRDNRFLNHPYLEDISSMDVHKNTLIAASSNGNIVIWNADNGDVCSWIDSSKSPQIFMPGQKEQGQTGSLRLEKNPKRSRTTNRTAVKAQPLIICLKKREVKRDTATLLTSADGYICAWSVNLKGGLLEKFRAVNEEGAVITTMSTDVNEDTLLTGDSTGKICQWDIRKFGFKKPPNDGPFEVINGWWHVSLAQPPLLGSGQCHLSEVVSVQFDRIGKEIITAGSDCQLRLWTNTGTHVGLFGKDIWGATQLKVKKKADQEEAANSATISLNNQKSVFDLLNEMPSTPIPDLTVPTNIDYLSVYKNYTKEELDAEHRELMNYVPGLSPDLQPGSPLRQSNKIEKIQVKQPPAKLSACYHNSLPDFKFIAADLKQTSTKIRYGRVDMNQKGDTIKDSVLAPCPPNMKPLKIFPGSLLPSSKLKQPPAYTLRRVPTMPEKVELVDQKTQLIREKKIQVKQPPAKLYACYHDSLPDFKFSAVPKQSSPHTRNALLVKNLSLQCMPHCVKNLTPCRQSPVKATKTFTDLTLPARKVKQPPACTLTHERIPTLGEMVELKCQRTQLKPQPPPVIRGEADLKQSYPNTRYGRLLKKQQENTIKDRVLTPCRQSPVKWLSSNVNGPSSSHSRPRSSEVKLT